MDLNLGGLVRQATAPVLDAVSLVRTAGVEQIASFLRDNPDQRGAIETALATGGRAGDLSAIVERAGAAAGQVVEVARGAVNAGTTSVGAATQPVQAAAGEVVSRLVTGVAGTVGRAGDVAGQVLGAGTAAVGAATQPVQAAASEIVSRVVTAATSTTGRAGEVAGQALGRVGGTAAEVLARPAQAAGETVARLAGSTPDALARPALAGETLARLAADPGRTALPTDMRGVPGLSRGPDIAAFATRTGGVPETGFATRAGDTLAAAIRDGKIAQLITAATKEGRLPELLVAARTAGQLPALVSAARTLDGVLAAFAAKGGLSATELALLARSGLLSEADTHALRSAGIAVDIDTEEPATLQPAPRDGPAEERFDTDAVPVEGSPVGGLANPALARFDSGAVRITSRAAVDTYGALGPPGGTVVAADAFEALLRASDGDLATVERRLGLDAGVLRDADTLVAFVERRDLAGLRLPPDGLGAAAASWLPGGDKAGGLLAALADLGRGTPFREMTFTSAGR